MSVFVDTSAIYAVLDAGDEYHVSAKEKWQELLNGSEPLICTNYILIETIALLQSRLGLDAVRAFQEDILPLLAVEWVDESAHAAAMSSLITAARRGLSIVDCISFDLMRRLGIHATFSFDKHFSEQGFKLK